MIAGEAAMVILTLLAAVHLYWAAGGNAGKGAAIPTADGALRAIGDFRYVGFFNRVRDTGFARLDTLAYSPLCAGLAVLIGIAAGG